MNPGRRQAVMVRALRLVSLMQGRSVRPTATQIARALGISERSAKRWLAACNEAHLPMPPSVDQVRHV